MKSLCISLVIVWAIFCSPALFAEDASVKPSGLEETSAADSSAGEPENDTLEKRSLLDEKEEFEDNFTGHEPIYMLYGVDPSSAKFQLSFKYRFFGMNAPLTKKWADMARFHFAYTQTSFWDLESDSNPFEDNNYKPELLYYREKIPTPGVDWIYRFNLQSGIQHESNGRDGENSRSLNILYIRPELVFGQAGDLQFLFSPKLWLYAGNLEDNPDIDEFRGYGDFLVKLGSADGTLLSCNARVGSDWNKGSLQFDLTYPLKKLFKDNLDIYFQVQYFTGYGESLLRYDEKNTRLRVGFAIFR